MRATTLDATKGRLIRCTVPGLTPNRAAILRIPGLPGVARASRICFSRAGAIGRTDSFLSHRQKSLNGSGANSCSEPCVECSDDQAMLGSPWYRGQHWGGPPGHLVAPQTRRAACPANIRPPCKNNSDGPAHGLQSIVGHDVHLGGSRTRS
jgi:hypothetical protein